MISSFDVVADEDVVNAWMMQIRRWGNTHSVTLGPEVYTYTKQARIILSNQS
jgi:hypothetical protein